MQDRNLESFWVGLLLRPPHGLEVIRVGELDAATWKLLNDHRDKLNMIASGQMYMRPVLRSFEQLAGFLRGEFTFPMKTGEDKLGALHELYAETDHLLTSFLNALVRYHELERARQKRFGRVALERYRSARAALEKANLGFRVALLIRNVAHHSTLPIKTAEGRFEHVGGGQYKGRLQPTIDLPALVKASKRSNAKHLKAEFGRLEATSTFDFMAAFADAVAGAKAMRDKMRRGELEEFLDSCPGYTETVHRLRRNSAGGVPALVTLKGGRQHYRPLIPLGAEAAYDELIWAAVTRQMASQDVPPDKR